MEKMAVIEVAVCSYSEEISYTLPTGDLELEVNVADFEQM